MKASVITAVTLAAYVMAGPIGLSARQNELDGECTCEVETITITVPGPTETIGGPTATVPATNTDTETNTATETSPETETNTATETNSETIPATETGPATETNTETGTATETNTATETGTATAPPTSTPTCDDDGCHGTGHLIQDLGPQVNRLLTVTGSHGETLLVQVNEDIYNLLEGNVDLSDSVGEILGDVASVGELIADLGPIVDCILTIVGEDAQILLVQLSPEVAELLRGLGVTLGLDSVNNPVGQIVQSLGINVKRQTGGYLFQVLGQDDEGLIVSITGTVGELLHSLHLSGVIGTVIEVAVDATELIQRLGPNSENLLVVLGRDGGALLIGLSPEVADLVDGLLPQLSGPVGAVVYVIGDNL
ncbi:hypothetical protein BJX63DRAFT_318754 [Aspergillus granulosus]|uniref:Uncharacterized protein n=1 Tax=Aspergillus granulosus TaxID=176169 RepID=A0ABR4H6E6_9EURO